MIFRNIKKEQELIDRELAVYKNEKIIEMKLVLAELAKQCAVQTGQYEHEFHSKREKLETELAVLEAKKDSYTSLLEERNKNYVAEYTAVNKANDRAIQTLQNTIEGLVGALKLGPINNNINNNK